MMRKKILITAGPVYGKIDSNKIISNRTRGIWAIKLARWMAREHQYDVKLLVADTLSNPELVDWEIADERGGRLEIVRHNGYHDYADKCVRYAEDVDAAVMAAAVLNYIPETTYEGKLPAKADRIALHFILAPKVINEMKKVNPRMTLIGCKLLFSEVENALIDAAYKVVLDARCNMVIANDGKNLKKKFLVHQDKTVIELDDDFDALYDHIRRHIEDKHWTTDLQREDRGRILHYSHLFNDVVDRYRDKFIRRQDGKDFVFGSVATHHVDPGYDHGPPEFLISPREKGQDFDNWDAGVCSFEVTLNAPLLVRHLNMYEDAVAVVHYHAPEKDDPGIRGLLPVAPYAPPGTIRDNNRDIPGPCYYIEGHGWIIALDKNLEPLSR
jgi:hypothetical protein